MKTKLAITRLQTQLASAKTDLKQEKARNVVLAKNLRQSELHHRLHFEESQEMQAQLRHLTHQVLLAQEEERKEISRELHDDIAQTLTAINVHLAAFTKEVTINTDGLQKKIARTQKLVEKSVNIVHRFARDLRPTLLDDLGLIPALHSYLKEFTKRTKVRISFTAFAGAEKLSSPRRTVLYRVAQSALNNIAQHARATQVGISIQKEKNSLRMTVHDDGRSFDVERVLFAKNRHRRKGLGLLGMRERIEMVGGTFSIASAPGKGTTIIAQLPFPPTAKKPTATGLTVAVI